MAERRCRATASSPTSSTCWPTSPSCSARRAFGSRPTGALPRGSERRPARSRRWRSRGRRRSSRDRPHDRGEDRRGRRARRDGGARQAPRAGAGGARRVPAPAGSRAQDRCADLARARRDDPGRAARGGGERSGCAVSPGLGARSEEKILEALRKGVGRDRPRRTPLGVGLPAVLEVVETLRAHPAAIRVSEAGSVRRRRETFRDLDLIATATDPAALTEEFVSLPLVAEVVAHGDTKATVISGNGLRFDLRVVPPESFGNLLQHFTGSKEHNVALREDAVRRGFSVSEYGDHHGCHRRGVRDRGRGGGLRASRLPVHPARAAREHGRAGGGAARAAAAARRARRPEGRPAHALDLVERRQGDARGDGPRGPCARLPLPRRDRPLALPARRTARAPGGGDRRAQRPAASRSGSCTGSRSTSRPTARSTSPTRSSPGSTG